ncbi:vitamin K-dependent gamma-carboxylase [Drosophila bipectinata]|uniref:vitamin K-dependent gamma-carboxylase n=1 Tax=Drosophila bipectinata TaxID=42026 RepID=UPI001C8A4214|nr:vitamin K-dependent gamma-carboxylase [Drosophila bipectinata]
MANSKRKLPTKANTAETNTTLDKETTSTAEKTKTDEISGSKKDCRLLNGFFRDGLGHDLDNFKSVTNFTRWLERPVDGAALGVFRMLYGAAMLIDIAEERGGGQLDVRFGEPLHCHFPLINGMRALDYPLMGCVYLCMWLGAWGIMLGYRFRVSCLAFLVPYWYIFLLDKPTWNNHSYLFGLVGTLLLFTQAEAYCSLDNWLHPRRSPCIPYWNYFLIKFQFFVLYMYAGLKKFSLEWLSGYAMSNLSQHWVFAPFRQMLDPELIDLLIVHWFTAFFDLSIAFFMTLEKTRLLVTPFMISFHLMNSRLFVIGMFPWVCLAEVPLFFSFDWPRRLWTSKSSTQVGSSGPKQPGILARLRTCLIIGYCALQLFLPYSHFITKGYNNWTNGLYGYSWDMMVHSYDTLQTSIQVVDNESRQVHNLNPFAFTEYDRWTKYADMAVQYAKCIEENLKVAQHPAIGSNISIYFDIWCSMNGRFQQRSFDPRVDLLKAKWSPFEATSWSLPLLTELNHMRPKLRNIETEVLAWNNYSDVVFVADFPGLTLTNFISPDLINCTLTILEGNVRYSNEQDPEVYFLTAGKSICLDSNITHLVTTIGQKPASYLFTYTNKTMLEQDMESLDEGASTDREERPLLPLWQEFQQRVSNYQQFLGHIGNCLLYLLYDVPIPLAVRERD